MFIILDSSNLIADISDNVRYVRRQDNGYIVGCEKEKAEAIYSANTDKFYLIEAVGYSESHTLIKVDEIPSNVVAGQYYYRDGEYHMTEEKQKLQQMKDALDMLVVSALQENKLSEIELQNAVAKGWITSEQAQEIAKPQTAYPY